MSVHVSGSKVLCVVILSAVVCISEDSLFVQRISLDISRSGTVDQALDRELPIHIKIIARG